MAGAVAGGEVDGRRAAFGLGVGERIDGTGWNGRVMVLTGGGGRWGRGSDGGDDGGDGRWSGGDEEGSMGEEENELVGWTVGGDHCGSRGRVGG